MFINYLYELWIFSVILLYRICVCMFYLFVCVWFCVYRFGIKLWIYVIEFLEEIVYVDIKIICVYRYLFIWCGVMKEWKCKVKKDWIYDFEGYIRRVGCLCFKIDWEEEVRNK